METLGIFLNQACLWIFAGLLIYAAWSDFKQYVIPNRIPLCILTLYPAYVMTAGIAVEWQMALAIAAGLLAVGLLFFAAGWMGGGDVKLITAAALWAGPEYSLHLLLLTAIAGGVLSLTVILWSKYGWVFGMSPGEVAEKIPYGIAVAGAGLFVAGSLISSQSAGVWP
ncbi:MAG: pilus assembly protein CpaA [Rhodospirillaceae bacterium]|jgi:prepilin peptidase CpaA|nr:pilus assembly protein CpaA [Rhodospirillaceae bacterium]